MLPPPKPLEPGDPLPPPKWEQCVDKAIRIEHKPNGRYSVSVYRDDPGSAYKWVHWPCWTEEMAARISLNLLRPQQ